VKVLFLIIIIPLGYMVGRRDGGEWHFSRPLGRRIGDEYGDPGRSD
jgi:hypothetical protein